MLVPLDAFTIESVQPPVSDAGLLISVEPRLVEWQERSDKVRTADPEQRRDFDRQRRVWRQGVIRLATEHSIKSHLLQRNVVEGRLTWFWCNHFSVLSNKGLVGLLFDSLEFDAVAPRIVSRYENLLSEAVLHPAMLEYLDNTRNRADRTNENLARELLELHTLGVNGGYTQQDVQQLALALTGVGIADIDRKTGQFCVEPRCIPLNAYGTVLRQQQHHKGPKRILGRTYDHPQGLEILNIVRDLARHPATARHLSFKLCQYWLGDQPDEADVTYVAKVYRDSDGDLKQVTNAVLALKRSNKATPSRLKDPFRYVTDALRWLKPDDEKVLNTFDAGPVVGLLRNLGMGHYQRVSPDGYPLTSTEWNNSSTLLLRLQAANQLVNQYRRMWPLADVRQQWSHHIQKTRPLLSASSRAAVDAVEGAPSEWVSMSLMTPEFMFE